MNLNPNVKQTPETAKKSSFEYNQQPKFMSILRCLRLDFAPLITYYIYKNNNLLYYYL